MRTPPLLVAGILAATAAFAAEPAPNPKNSPGSPVHDVRRPQPPLFVSLSPPVEARTAPSLAVSSTLPTSADPEFMAALTVALQSGRDDPEVKAAEAAMAAVHKANHGLTLEAVDKVALETAQLRLELALMKKARALRPAIETSADVRGREIRARLKELRAAEEDPAGEALITVPNLTRAAAKPKQP